MKQEAFVKDGKDRTFPYICAQLVVVFLLFACVYSVYVPWIPVASVK